MEDLSEQASLRYKQGWRALNRLLHQDRSFSGRERNCAFLNCGTKEASFATVSGVAGFDFPDDARGLATVDWDFDGDLDVWATNRTAPRVRVLMNRSVSRPFLAVKLSGDGRTTNRDALGARLEVYLAGGAGAPRRIRTLRGGEGFLSQSSHWVHFGLGDAQAVEKLVVRWPGGSEEEFRGLEKNSFYRLAQGSGRAVRFVPPGGRAPLVPSPPPIAEVAPAARIVVPPGLPIPELAVLSADGGELKWSPRPGRTVVLNLWSTTCAPCLAELKEWAAAKGAFAKAGIEVITLNTDGLVEGEGVEAIAVARLLKETAGSMAGHRLASAGLQALSHLDQTVLDRWQSLPLPTSFLVDSRGELAVIYKGRVEASQIIKDRAIADGDASVRRAAGTPLPGRWLDPVAPRADPKRLAGLMLDHDEPAAAIAYLERCLGLLEARAEKTIHSPQVADLKYLVGVLKRDPHAGVGQEGAINALRAARDLNPNDFRVRRELAHALFNAGDGAAAAVELQAAVTINPSDTDAGHELADLWQRLGRYDQAEMQLREMANRNPKDGVILYRLAGVLAKAGDTRKAIETYRQALSASPRLLEAANDLARLLATHEIAGEAAPDEALALAQRLCAITENGHPGFLETLALALAGKGDFEAAAAAMDKAIPLVPPDDTSTRAAMAEKREAYRRRVRPAR